MYAYTTAAVQKIMLPQKLLIEVGYTVKGSIGVATRIYSVRSFGVASR